MKIPYLQSISIQFLCFSFFIFIGSQLSYSQENKEKIDELINEGNFEDAIMIGNQMLEELPDDPILNFKIGYCYLNTILKKSMATSYLKKSVDSFKNSNSQNSLAIEARFYLGKSFHKNSEFEQAIDIFDELKAEIKNKEMLSAIDQEIQQCNNGIKFKNNPVNIQITNIGQTINSNYTDHSPVVAADESVLIFTSRRKQFETEQAKPDGQYNEDIYISNFDNGGWSKPVGISKNINTDAHEASIGLSADGQQLLIYRDLEGGTILSSYLIGDEWSSPSNLGENINTRSRETHATISSDNNLLYFTSDRAGGYGGLDIYQSVKQPNGSWGKAVNLGPTINTAQDEEGPFIHPDGINLYFSSKGHETMGGYDIFLSKKNEFGTWSIPENLGYPINTTEDDVFFNTTPDGKRAYFSSYHEDGFGFTDIYMMGLPEAEEKPVTVVKGVVAACKSEIKDVQISIFDNSKNGEIGMYKPNSTTGKYLFILTRGKKYKAIFKVGDNIVHTEEFHISENADYQVIYKLIELKPQSPCNEFVGRGKDFNEIVTSPDNIEEDASVSLIENVLFKINNAEVSYFTENITKLANYLKKNKSCKIELIGYSDTQGQETYNLKLSTQRAKNVYEYLIKLGVNKDQLSYRGNGEKNQITINNYPDGSYIWQSIPYNRRVEFKVLADTLNKLVIKQIIFPRVYVINKNKNDSIYISEYEKKFTIQIGAYSKPIGKEYFKNINNLQMFYNGKLYHYTFGEFETEELASAEIKKVYDMGYRDAFIRRIAYYFPEKLR